ncbi:uncharacterized protein LOC112091723 [Morus notabilis]|uniref:uncharacterized protein LOC112091723 n=1 Tax=Morus notabilis TaxID=981085 RepID=UPI000CED3879|nr:uncharacterized protein LOC112091723 [Morus notabilis]
MEFMTLQQGDMSIREYGAKFNDFSRFAPSLVESEHLKCLKFEKGLKNSEVASQVFASGGPSASFGLQWSGRRNSSSSGTDRSGPYSPKCHYCGQVGHIRRNCPNRSEASYGQGRPPQFVPPYQPQLPMPMPYPHVPTYHLPQYPQFQPQASGPVQIPPPQQYRPGTQRPNIGDKGKGKAQGQAYTLTRGSSEGQASNMVVEGMSLISHSLAHVLFDTSATHILISSSFVQTLKLKFENLEILMMLNSPLGCVEVASVCRSFEVTIGGERLRADLIILPMSLFDVVFRMDWLARYSAIVDYYHRRVTLMTNSGVMITYQADMNPVLKERLLRYSIGGRRNLACFSFLLALEGEPEVIGDNAKIPMVDEFAYVFPDELPGLPPDREIKFGIDLMLGTAPISIPPY